MMKNIKKKLAIQSKYFLYLFVILVFAVISVFFAYTRKVAKKDMFVEIIVAAPNWWLKNTSKPPYWLAESIKINDQDNPGNPTVTIIDKKTTNLVTSGSNFFEEKESELAQQTSLILKMELTESNGKLFYNGQPLAVGSPLEINLTQTHLTAIVVNISETESSFPPKETIKIRGVLKNREESYVKQIKTGLEGLDFNGNRAFKVTLANVLPQQTAIPDYQGNLLTKNNPLEKSLDLEIELEVENKNGKYIYEDLQEIKVGNYISLYSPEINVLGIRIDEIFYN